MKYTTDIDNLHKYLIDMEILEKDSILSTDDIDEPNFDEVLTEFVTTCCDDIYSELLAEYGDEYGEKIKKAIKTFIKRCKSHGE